MWDFAELDNLSGLRNLQVVNFEFNPISHDPHYRSHVIARIPSLSMVDSRTIDAAERVKAPGIVRMEEIMLNMMYSNECVIMRLQSALDRVRMHQELREVAFGRISALNRLDFPMFTAFKPNFYLKICSQDETLCGMCGIFQRRCFTGGRKGRPDTASMHGGDRI